MANDSLVFLEPGIHYSPYKFAAGSTRELEQGGFDYLRYI